MVRVKIFFFVSFDFTSAPFLWMVSVVSWIFSPSYDKGKKTLPSVFSKARSLLFLYTYNDPSYLSLLLNMGLSWCRFLSLLHCPLSLVLLSAVFLTPAVL